MKILTPILLLLPACEILIHRPPIVTRDLAAQAREKEASAAILEAYAYHLRLQSLCLESHFPKGIPAVADAQKTCGVIGPIPVTVTLSEKTGEVPHTEFSLTPASGLTGLGLILGLTQ